jgi:D-alanyl-D-alanine carboxypeptidase/D-alanyl-D-alanine endopeptidase (penicillin-binding protein 7)
MIKPIIAAILLASSFPAFSAIPFQSTYAMVVDESTGEVLLDKQADSAAPIASVTKLLTALVVLDAASDDSELITIERGDVDSRERIRTCLPVGTTLPRRDMLQLALMASDNHAAAALARAYPGGREAFDAAMAAKIDQLGLQRTVIEEPTGLSPNNRASAEDLVKVLQAASAYPEIHDATTQTEHTVEVRGRAHSYHNTNKLVGQPGWDILLSKTGTTTAAGRCLVMRLQEAGRTVLVVLMGGKANASRVWDALNVRRWLDGEEPATRSAPATQVRAMLARSH